MSPETRTSLQARMKRISGQVSGIQRMLDEDRYCVDILNQISAVRSATVCYDLNHFALVTLG